MKKLLLFSLLIITTSGLTSFSSKKQNLEKVKFAEKTSIDSLDKKIIELHRLINELEENQNFLIREVHENKLNLKNVDDNKSIYSSLLSTQTGIFSIIVAIAIFIAGYVIPRKNETKYKELIEKLEKEQEEDRNYTLASISFLDMVRLIERKSYWAAIVAAIKSLESLLQLESFEKSGKIDMILSYILGIKQKITPEIITKVKDKKGPTLKKVLDKLTTSDLTNIDNKNLDAFMALFN